MKKPILAAIFNAIIPGTGYLYTGVRKKFAVLLIASLVVYCFALADPQSPYYFGNEQMPYTSFWEWISLTLVAIAFGYDAYTEAKAKNLRNSTKQ